MASILPRGTLVADADTDRQDEDVWIGTAEVSFTPARGPGRVPSPKHYTCWHLWFTAPGAVREQFWCLSHPCLNIPLELAKKYKCSCSEKFLYEKSWQLIYALKMKKKKKTEVDVLVHCITGNGVVTSPPPALKTFLFLVYVATFFWFSYHDFPTPTLLSLLIFPILYIEIPSLII